MLPSTSRLRSLYLSHLSKPAVDRPVYQAIRRHRVRRILELGIGVGQRSARMIEAAAYCHPIEEVRYFGIDPFEGRCSADGPGVTLKMAHRHLTGMHARVQLIPGDPYSGLSRSANSIGQIDLIVISHRIDPSGLARAWLYMPRMMHGSTLVLRETVQAPGRTAFRPIDRAEIDELAATGLRRAA